MNSVKAHLAKTPPQTVPVSNGQPLLFHYTTLAGLTGILGTQSLWASCIHYLNDSEEFKHGLDVVKEIAWDRLPTATGAHALFLKRVMTAVAQYAGGFVYLASFAEDGDLLSQWRGYAHTGGVSIGFDFFALRELASSHNFLLVKCIYDHQTKRRLASEFLDDALSRIPSDAELMEGEVEIKAYAFIERYFQISAAFKNPSFVEEDEWRLVSRYVPVTHPRVKVRTTTRMLVPYYDLPLDRGKQRENRKDLGIEVITVGPSSEQPLLMNAISVPTHGNGLWVSTVRPSRIPYRPL